MNLMFLQYPLVSPSCCLWFIFLVSPEEGRASVDVAATTIYVLKMTMAHLNFLKSGTNLGIYFDFVYRIAIFALSLLLQKKGAALFKFLTSQIILHNS